MGISQRVFPFQFPPAPFVLVKHAGVGPDPLLQLGAGALQFLHRFEQMNDEINPDPRKPCNRTAGEAFLACMALQGVCRQGVARPCCAESPGHLLRLVFQLSQLVVEEWT